MKVRTRLVVYKLAGRRGSRLRTEDLDRFLIAAKAIEAYHPTLGNREGRRGSN